MLRLSTVFLVIWFMLGQPQVMGAFDALTIGEYKLKRKIENVLPDVSLDQIFVFSTSKKNWHRYDWDKITSLVECGYHDDELVNFAHSKNVSVSYIPSITAGCLTNASVRAEWVKNVVNYVITHKLDGINIDYESPINTNETVKRNGFTQLLQELTNSLKTAMPRAQVTIDFAWSPNCIDGRCYDYAALAEIVDFAFVMAYDERSQIFGPCIAWANSAINVTLTGLTSYFKLGIRPSKLVLGVPWYGYDYKCIDYDRVRNICHINPVPFRGCNCSDAAGSQIGYSDMMDLVKQSITGRLWDQTAMSPYATYRDRKSGQLHQIWFDDVQSLAIKYNSAQLLGLLGVGMWEADSLDYTDTPEKRLYVEQMWNALPRHNNLFHKPTF